MRICTIKNCNGKYLAKGVCNKHYRRIRKHGVYDYDPKGSRYTHGMSNSKEYRIWSGVKARCKKLSHPSYKNYGGRGITVCEMWDKSFESFYASMGDIPGENYQIDRIDNEKGYEPGNCRWATRKQNNRNRRDNLILEYGNKKMSLVEWSEEIGIKSKTLHHRVYGLGWDVKKAIETPVKKYRNAL